MHLYSQVLAGAAVLALLGAFVWGLRRAGGVRLPVVSLRGRSAAMLESSERLRLSPQHSLHLVRLGDRAMLVAVHASGCTLLESRPWCEVGCPGTAGPEGREG
jgi:flagellar biogenesis protein FliO